MNKIIIVLSFMCCAIFVQSCSLYNKISPKSPEVLIKKDFDGNGIAVLTFVKQGPSLAPDAGRIAADKLTDAMFIKGNFNVIDRARVNEAQSILELATTELLSADQIQRLGLKLKANFIVLGRVQSVSDQEYFDMNPQRQLYISFRIISVANSEVIGVANYSSAYTDNNVLEKVTQMMNDIIGRMK